MSLFFLFFLGLVFFWNSDAKVKLTAFVLMILSGAAVGYTAYSLTIVSSITGGGGSLKLPSDARFGFLKGDRNVLIFDASSDKKKAKELAKAIIDESSISSVDILIAWKGEWAMDHTRIYYQGEDENESQAYEIASSLHGTQFVIDYEKQLDFQDPAFWPDKSEGDFTRMVGFNEDRDLVIFAGNDINLK
ncbi:hypothetical protein BCF46_1881 [Litoreibacter meonggei]|uniref:Uncharacterized protein n=2 Tax=Litoreibacter meonggei TaxID=1049199 RepID=A0A497WKD9_9RHOB|nr:hypothetical protein BCF46_1881 [Litoreibacter meonggei]